MKRIVSIILVLSIVLVSSCVRKPSSYSRTPANRSYPSASFDDDSDEYGGVKSTNRRKPSTRNAGSTRASRAIHSATHDTSLPTKVKRLANQIERKFRADSYTADDLDRWANLYIEYVFEYSLSTQNLTDEQCESIEFNLGRIAGAVYKDGVVPVLNELEKISEGVEDYEERSKKWQGAAERGFKSVAGDVDLDF